MRRCITRPFLLRWRFFVGPWCVWGCGFFLRCWYICKSNTRRSESCFPPGCRSNCGWGWLIFRRWCWRRRFTRRCNCAAGLTLLGTLILAIHPLLFRSLGGIHGSDAPFFGLILAVFVLAPLAALARNVQKFNFLQIGRQRNLIYAVFATFLALLYLSLVRRASLWFEPYLPPEASAALLLFLPVVFFEPLQRLMRRTLRRTAQTEMDRAQHMMGPIQEVARVGNLGKLTGFAEKWIGEELQLAEVKFSLGATMPGGSEQKASEE